MDLLLSELTFEGLGMKIHLDSPRDACHFVGVDLFIFCDIVSDIFVHGAIENESSFEHNSDATTCHLSEFRIEWINLGGFTNDSPGREVSPGSIWRRHYISINCGFIP